MKTNLRNLRPAPPQWSGITISDALHRPDYHVLETTDQLADQLARRGTSSLAIYPPPKLADAHTPAYWALAPESTTLFLIQDKLMTAEMLAELSRVPWLVFNGAETLGQLANRAGRWPSSCHCLLTMAQIVENGAVGDNQPEGEHDWGIADVLGRNGIAWQGGNPAPLLHLLFKHLLTRLLEGNLIQTYELERRLLRVTHRMQSIGIGVDRPALEAVHGDYTARTTDAAAHLRQALKGALPNPDDDAAILARLQDLGLPVSGTSAEDLCGIDDPAVTAVQTYRQVRGIRNAAQKYLAVIGADGRVHPHWHQLGAVTGRYTCDDPPFQALPRNPDLRRCFRPRPGFLYVSCDFAQADLRPLAFATQDAEMLSIFKEGLDFHRETAARLMGKLASQVTPEERNVSKAIVFGVVYGMGVKSLVTAARLDYGLVWTEEDAQAWMDRFFTIYTGLRTWREELRRQAGEANECRTLFYKRRRLLPAEATSWWERFASLSNMPAQGTVADAIKEAMIAINAQLNPEDAIIANLHDELLLEVHQDRATEVAVMVQAEMEKALGRMLPGVPVKAEHGIFQSLAKA